jgi:hypothetical protein
VSLRDSLLGISLWLLATCLLPIPSAVGLTFTYGWLPVLVLSWILNVALMPTTSTCATLAALIVVALVSLRIRAAVSRREKRYVDAIARCAIRRLQARTSRSS